MNSLTRNTMAALFGFVLAAALIGCRPAPMPIRQLDPPPLERPPYDPNLTQKTLEFWVGKVKQDPQGAIEYGKLAGVYLQRCRETGDIADAIKAEQAARRSLAIRTRNNYAAYDSLALSLLSQHRFHEATELAGRAAAMRPDDAEALYLDIEARIEMGDYTQAESLLNRLHRADESPFSYALRARLCEMEGRPQGALDYLRAAQK